jgi:hypothetical protein
MIFGFGTALLVIGIVMVITQLNFYQEQNKSEIQIQTDSLIADITSYEKTIPQMPQPTYSKDPIEMQKLWDEYNKAITDYYSKLNSDFFDKFNTRIANTIIKLHNLNIISDTEFEQTKSFYNFMPTAHVGLPILLERLNTYKVRLDERVKALAAK